MQWVFIALIVLIVSILVSVLQRGIAAVKNSYYIPPSEAVIDQSMPQEVMEHIFSFMDPLTLLQSHNVSKYWRSHASKDRIKTMVLERYVNSIQRELPGIEPDWFEYHEDYPIDRRLSDIALAQKRGRDLLELRRDEKFFRQRGLPDFGNRFTVKLVSRIAPNLPYRFVIGKKYVSVSNSTKEMESILSQTPHGWFDSAVHYEVMVNLEDYCSDQLDVNFIMCRKSTEDTKRFGKFGSKDLISKLGNAIVAAFFTDISSLGIIPLDSSFLPTMIFLMIPLVVHDALYSEFLSVIKQWFGSVVFLTLNGMFVYFNLTRTRHYETYRNVELFKELVVLSSIAAIIVFVLLYPISSTHFTFIGMTFGTLVYAYRLYEHCFSDTRDRTKYKDRLQLYLICLALALLMNDWSMTIQSFIDGAIWLRLFWNGIHFLFFMMYASWISAMSSLLQNNTKGWDWRYLMDMYRDVQMVTVLACLCCSSVIVTLYAPYWQINELSSRS